MLLYLLHVRDGWIDVRRYGNDEDHSFPVLSTMILLRKPRILARIQHTGWSDPYFRVSIQAFIRAVNVYHSKHQDDMRQDECVHDELCQKQTLGHLSSFSIRTGGGDKKHNLNQT